MLDQHFRRPRVRARLRADLLGCWIEAYVDYLDQRGHAPGTIQQYVQGVEHFGVWLAFEHITIEDVTRATIDSFLHDHLPENKDRRCIHERLRGACAKSPVTSQGLKTGR
jgi:site-specific recombinase XerD